MTLEPSASTEDFVPDFPASETFAPEFPAETGDMMMGAPEQLSEISSGDQQGDAMGNVMGNMMGSVQTQEPISANDFGNDFAQNTQGVDMMGGMQTRDTSDFGEQGQMMNDYSSVGQQSMNDSQSRDDFFSEVPTPAPQTQTQAPAAPGIDDSAMRAWKARQDAVIQEKRVAEERELKHIHEEAQAERELAYSQRERQIAAAKKANREREVVMEASKGEGWEAVLNLISDTNLVKETNTDLSRFKQILTRLKHQKPMTAM